MKIFFIALVLCATTYLLIPQDIRSKVHTLLSFDSVENSSEQLVKSINQKIETEIEHAVLAVEVRHQERFKKLDNQIASLSTLVQEQNELLKQTNIVKKPNKGSEESGIYAESERLKTTNASSLAQVNLSPAPQYAKAVALGVNADQDTKHFNVKRQASLQDIVDKMNNASLRAFTQ